ncbi:hypothetical protein Taro_020335 [Colocasia esculenta]|uniref:Uncharacterized protein n=1 Tax=Colocasia esculenta TaxID=4460 RepID=A0A843UZB7_COLES|nr:hypothetical protein [Colocasia esculenta]
MSIPQPFFPSYNRTPKHHGYLKTLHQTLGTSFRTCWGCVEEFLEARELWIDHRKLIFFPFLICCDLHKPPSWSRAKGTACVQGLQSSPNDGES